jgi:hypothetical protein
MSQDPISVTTRTSWLSRLGSAFGGVLTGLALIVASVCLLAWNEGRSVQSIRANKEGATTVTAVSPDRIAPANEGRLIHVTAPAAAEGQRADAALDVSAEGLLLSRKVEYFHWVETSRSEARTRLGGGEETVTTYSYDRRWTPTPQDSTGYQQAAAHQNPSPAIKDAAFHAEQARLGAFTVDRAVLDQVSADQPLGATEAQATTASTALSRPVRVQNGALYVGANPAAPQVGDMRISYLVAPQNQVLSIVGAQAGETIRPYATKAGSPILMVRKGTASADEMFEQAKAANQTLGWILRGVGVAVSIAAFGMVLAPLGVLVDVVPLFGSIVRMGTGLVAGAAGLIVSALVIASAWIVYRPLLGVALIAVAAGVTGFLIWRARSKSA